MEMELHVRVVSARHLPTPHGFGGFGGFGGGGRLDPFCKLRVGDKKFKTRVDENGHRTPVWDEKFVFEVYDPHHEQIYIEVKDKGFSDDMIAEVRLPVNMFLHGQLTDQWYQIYDGSRPAGEINLRVQLMSDPAYATQPQYVQQQPPQYAQAPPPQYAQAPPQPVYQASQPPPVVVSAAPQVVVSAPPPVVVAPSPVVVAQPVAYATAPAYGAAPGYYPSHDHHHGGDSGRGVSGAQVALGVGAGVLGGLVLGEALDEMF